MTIGERIKSTRLALGLTQMQLGDKCGMQGANVRKYESGKVNPKYETLERIATALGVRESFLRNGAEKIKVMYVCDQKSCEALGCLAPQCTHTMEIEHAVNFQKSKFGDDTYWEKENADI